MNVHATRRHAMLTPPTPDATPDALRALFAHWAATKRFRRDTELKRDLRRRAELIVELRELTYKYVGDRDPVRKRQRNAERKARRLAAGVALMIYERRILNALTERYVKHPDLVASDRLHSKRMRTTRRRKHASRDPLDRAQWSRRVQLIAQYVAASKQLSGYAIEKFALSLREMKAQRASNTRLRAKLARELFDLERLWLDAAHVTMFPYDARPLQAPFHVRTFLPAPRHSRNHDIERQWKQHFAFREQVALMEAYEHAQHTKYDRIRSARADAVPTPNMRNVKHGATR